MTVSATNQGLKPGVCTSTSRPTSPFDGMMIYETDTNLVRIWNGTAWKTLAYSDYSSGSVIQVASTTKTDTFSASIAAGASTAITGLSATITPTASSSKILVMAFVPMGISVADSGPYLTLYRGATAVGVGAAAGSRQTVTTGMMGNSNLGTLGSAALSFLDSPSTTSATTYSVNVSHSSSVTRTVVVNRSSDDTDNIYWARSSSSITLMEIAG